MTMEREFDLEKFRDRCVREFCELKEKPTQAISYHKTKKMKHYAPGLNDMQLSQWDNAQKHIIQQTDFAAPFIFKEDTAYGVIDIHRPLLVIKFGHECYWRAVPKRDAQACIEIAKAKNIYAKLRTVPLPKRTEIKEQTVQSFIERVRLETLNPPEDCQLYKGILTLSDGSVLNSNNYWHPSAQTGIALLVELHEKNIDLTAYYQMFSHIQPGVTEGWVIVDDLAVESFIEYRIDRTFYQKIVPEFLREQVCAYAKRLARFHTSPRHLLNGKNISYLKK